eukprot:m.306675 g.306675  ORF g.306675 m.306675 type:complete len:250 (+) comp41478_c0_seq1:30-779(+)
MAEATAEKVLGSEAHPATEEEFAYFLRLADSDDGYVEQYVKNGIQVLSKPMENSPIKMLKVRYEFEQEPELLYDVLHDPDYRREWDEHMIDGFEICTLNATDDIGYYSVKLPFPIKNRDFVNQRSWRVNDERSEFIIFNHSVTHKDQPEKSQFIRSVSYITGYLLRKHENGGTSFTYITQSDPKGWFPAWFINKAASRFAPRIIEQLGRVSCNYKEWKSQHNPDFKPWIFPDQMSPPGGKGVKPDGYVS